MSTSYATYEQYVTATGDAGSERDQVEEVIEELSAELRAECGVADSGRLAGDAGILARRLVIDAARKALVPPSFEGFEDNDLSGARQVSFTANGFTKSMTLGTYTGSAWFDSRQLARLKRLLGRGMRMGYVWPGAAR